MMGFDTIDSNLHVSGGIFDSRLETFFLLAILF